MDESRRERIKKNLQLILEYKNISSYKASERAGFARTFIDDFMRNRKKSLGEIGSQKIAKILDINEEYIDINPKALPQDMSKLERFGYNKPPFSNFPKSIAHVDNKRVHDGNIPLGAIPEIDAYLGAGGDSGYPLPAHVDDGIRRYSADAVRDMWIFPVGFLTSELHVPLDMVDILQVRGDSMTTPENDGFRDGDRVIVNRRDTFIRQGGVFAIRDHEETIIKQIELVRDTDPDDPPRIKCTSLNPRYEPFELFLDGSTTIIGRIVCKISRV